MSILPVRELVHPTTGQTFKLGRQRPISHCRSLHLKNYLMRSYAPPPAAVNWVTAAKPSLNLIYLNDTLGDCVIAWGAHMEGILTGNATGVPILYTEDQIKREYRIIGGYDGTPQSDQGCDEVTALNFWQQNGFAGGTKIAGWMRVNGADPTEVRAAIDLFGTITFGVELPNAWCSNMPSASGFSWDTAGTPDPNNGHCFGGCGYVSGQINISTWGMTGWITDAAVAEYTANSDGGELYTVLSMDWLSKVTEKSPSGFDWSQLQADLASMR